MKKENMILFSGGAQGAEAEFGANAERLGIEEVNFTFDGHGIVREERPARPESRRAEKRGREPCVRVEIDESPVHGKSDVAQGPAEYLVSDQQRAGNLRGRGDPGRQHRQGGHRLGRRVCQDLQQDRCTCSIRGATPGSAGTRRSGSNARGETSPSSPTSISRGPGRVISRRTARRRSGSSSIGRSHDRGGLRRPPSGAG